MEKIKRLSDFLCISEKSGLVAAFHQLSPEPLFLSGENWENTLSSLKKKESSPLLHLLEAKNLLVEKKDDQRLLTEAREKALRELNNPQILYLVMTNSCNYGCSYCPITIHRTEEKMLSLIEAIYGINIWKNHIKSYPKSDKPYFIIFYGGEPLLNWKTIEKTLSFLSEEKKRQDFPKDVVLLLCTNGSLITTEIAKKLAENNVSVALGADVLQGKNGKLEEDVSFLKAVKILIQEKVPIFSSLTITPRNIDYLEDYSSFLQKIGIEKLGLNLMKGEAVLREIGKENMEDYAKSCARVIASEKNLNEYQREKKIEIIQKGLSFSIDCTCYGSQIVIYPNGQLCNCPFLPLLQGHVSEIRDDFLISETKIVKKWRERIPIFNNTLLRENNNSLLDGGGCAWSSQEISGSVTARDQINSIFTKEVGHEIVWSFLPKKEARRILKERSYYWNYRRIGNV
jgi:sulfatase maturation enzyme AslB (radical SAM superfamily)